MSIDREKNLRLSSLAWFSLIEHLFCSEVRKAIVSLITLNLVLTVITVQSTTITNFIL